MLGFSAHVATVDGLRVRRWQAPAPRKRFRKADKLCSLPPSQAQAAPVACRQQCVTTCEVRVRAQPVGGPRRRPRRRAGRRNLHLLAELRADCWTACATQIRFTRLGRNKSPFFRVVVMDSRTRRDGRPLEVSPRARPRAAPHTRARRRHAAASFWRLHPPLGRMLAWPPVEGAAAQFGRAFGGTQSAVALVADGPVVLPPPPGLSRLHAFLC